MRERIVSSENELVEEISNLFAGNGSLMADNATAWNGSDFVISPVQMNRRSDLATALPPNLDSLCLRDSKGGPSKGRTLSCATVLNPTNNNSELL